MARRWRQGVPNGTMSRAVVAQCPTVQRDMPFRGRGCREARAERVVPVRPAAPLLTPSCPHRGWGVVGVVGVVATVLWLTAVPAVSSAAAAKDSGRPSLLRRRERLRPSRAKRRLGDGEEVQLRLLVRLGHRPGDGLQGPGPAPPAPGVRGVERHHLRLRADRYSSRVVE